jgi:outer membrane protein OmpA-like peptidoglycan-associated protein
MARMQSEISQEQARDAEMRSRQLEAELRELNAKQTERGLVITLGDVLFDTNKAQLKPGGIGSLEKLAGFLKQYPGRNVRIEGYTDSTGSADYNLGLSDRRANAVRSSLLDMGINSDRITTRGYGEESPVASNDTAMGRQLNRRVEIILSDETDGVSSR